MSDMGSEIDDVSKFEHTGSSPLNHYW